MQKTLLFIVNPKAGRARSSAPLFDAAAMFSEAGYLVSIQRTKGPRDATRLARDLGPQFDMVVCCGGDGTLNETVAGLAQLPQPPQLGYIPAGSTNDFAASLGLPSDPRKAAQRILEGQQRPLDLGSFCGRPFVYVASFGAFAKTSYSASQSVKNDLGHLAYLLEGVKDLDTLRPYKARFITQTEVIQGSFLFGAVTNSTSVGGLVKLPKDQVIMDDGKFELLLVPIPKTIQALHALVRSLTLQDFTGTALILRHVERVEVEMPEELPWTLDGEYAPGSTQMEIHVDHDRMKMLV